MGALAATQWTFRGIPPGRGLTASPLVPLDELILE